MLGPLFEGALATAVASPGFLLGYYGLVVGRSFGIAYKDRLQAIFSTDILKRRNKSRSNALPKVFDTSVIIDGRIQEILKTGFIEGNIIISSIINK